MSISQKSLFLLIFLFLFDCSTKIFFLNFSKEISFFPFFKLFLSQNKNFLFEFSPFLYYFAFVLILIFLLFFLIKSSNKRKSFFLGLIIIGGTSNFLDYLYFGSVIDFIDFFSLLVFNLADLYIVSGVIGLFSEILFRFKKQSLTGLKLFR